MEIKIFENVVEDALFIRNQVFVLEQGFDDGVDEQDNISTHVVIYKDKKPVATGRTFKKDDYYYIGRVAVIKECRGLDYGTKIIQSLEEVIEKKHNKIALSAQVHAISFYEKLGYNSIGDVYLDHESPHIKMIKILE